MYLPPRYYVINADRFDGATPIAAAWQPNDTDPNTPRHSITVEVAGRLSFRNIMRPGTAGAIVMIRRWGPAGAGADQVTLRTVSAAETATETTPDSPVPIDVDRLLESRPLLNTWSRPFFAGPTDAITIGWLPDNGGTVEVLVAEIGDILLAAQVQGLLECCAADGEFTTLLIEGDTTIAPWSGTLFALAQTPLGALVGLPPIADVTVGTRMVYIQGQGSAALDGNLAETINGQAQAAVPLGSMVIVEATPFGWSMTGTAEDPNVTTLSNAVAGTTVAVPPWTGFKTFLVDFTADGSLQLPDSALCGSNAEAIFVRTGAGESLARILPFAGQTINAGAAGAIFAVPLIPQSCRLKRRIAGNWVLTREGSEVPVETLVAGNKVYASGWPGRRILRLSAGGQTVTMPPFLAVPCPVDCELVVVNIGAAAATIQQSAVGEPFRGGGATGANISVVQNQVAVIRLDGIEWLWVT